MKKIIQTNNEDEAMSLPLIKKITHTLLFFSITVVSGLSHADDTEIYFNSTASSATAPNVLLILDTSGSMTANVTGTTQSRIEAMKEAMVDIITNTNDVNMGLMRFTNNDGGPILHEIRDLEDSASVPSVSATITSGNDDGEEITSKAAADPIALNTVTLTDPVIELAEIGSTPGAGTLVRQINEQFGDVDEFFGNISETEHWWIYNGGNQETGSRFTAIDIPQGAKIDSAFLTVTPVDGTGTDTAQIFFENLDFPSAYADSPNNLSTRTTVTAGITTQFGGAGATITSPDLSSIIQPIICRGVAAVTANCPITAGNWVSGNPLSMIVKNHTAGSRRFHSWDTNPAQAPILTINYTPLLAAGATPQTQLIAYRFNNILIPGGATITSAKLSLTASSSDSATGTADVVTISAEDPTSGNSAAFTAASANLSSRTKTSTKVDWTLPATTVNTAHESPDISSVVQKVIKNNANWCGGNSLTIFIEKKSGDETRHFHSYDGNSSYAPQLEIEYDDSTATGCFKSTETAQIAQSADDTEDSNTGGSQLDMEPNNDIGLRFQKIDIPQGATILSASIEFTARKNDTSATSIKIYGEDQNDASSYGNASTRTKTTAFKTWTPTNWSTNQTYDTIDIKELVDEIVDPAKGVNSNNWVSGNDMAFIFVTTSGDRRARSYNDNPQKAPRLSISYETTGASASVTVTVRENLIDIVNSLPANDWTPITEVFYESAHYWRGESVAYGKSRDGRSDTRISSASTYTGGTVNYPSGCTEDNLNASACSSQSITGSPIYKSPFTSSLSCQTNYQVLLTDGEANSNDIASTINTEFALGGCQTKKSDNSNVTGGELCSIDLVKFLLEKDQTTAITGDQTVKTYTVGFDTGSLANATQFLKDVAAAGGGEFFEAQDKQGLIDQFNEILSDVKSDTTSFAAPSIAVNTFNRLFSRDEIYFGLFAPELETKWDGNLKKYKICVDADTDDDGTDECTLGDVLDATNTPAVVDSPTASDLGLFKDSRQEGASGSVVAQSVWSTAADGREIKEGGAGGEIGTGASLDYTNRIIYTDVNNGGTAATGTSLEDGGTVGFKVTATNWTGTDTNRGAVRQAVCGSSAANPSQTCIDTMEWMLGKDVLDEDDDTGTNTRWWFNDILHSSPNVITYGQDGSDNFIDKILVGTNSGSLHMINGSNGVEDWSFIPNAMLTEQKTLFDNVSPNHVYGLDTTPILRVVDHNIDGTIDPTVTPADFVHVYSGQRRGGSHYYALDITPSAVLSNVTAPVTPKFLWRIDPVNNADGSDANCEFAPCAQGDFSRLGQSWSEPAIAKIKVVDSSGVQINGGQTVLIFGGGYDSSLDSLDDGVDIERNFGTEGGDPNDGNAIYIVDAATGKMIFWISHAAEASPVVAASGAHIQVPGMKYSIPSNITVFDSDGDGFDDRLYVGDTAGNVWRVDLAEDIKPSVTTGAQGSSVVGKLAALSTAGSINNERRIFYRPSVSQVRDTEFSNAAGGEYDYILVTTGNRANPLNVDLTSVKDVNDGLYALRDTQTGPMTGSSNLAVDYPKTVTFNATTGATSALGAPIAVSDLSAITLTSGLSSTSTPQKNSLGWYLDFDSTGTEGEKGLAAVRVFFGAVFLTTYVPDNSSTVAQPCQASVGSGRIFNFNILNGKPALFWDGGDNSSYSEADIVQTLGAGGIAPEVVPVYTPDGVTILAGKENVGLAGENEAVQTYWYQE